MPSFAFAFPPRVCENHRPCRFNLVGRLILGIFVCLISICAASKPAKAAGQEAQLTNDLIELDLAVDAQGVPVISTAKRIRTGETLFSDAGVAGGLSAWLPGSLITASRADSSTISWTLSEDTDFNVAQATLGLGKGLSATWVVELIKHGTLFRMHVILANNGARSVPVQTYPAWVASWQLPSPSPTLRWWDSLTFGAHQQTLGAGSQVSLGNQLYSAASGGTNPFWSVSGDWGGLYFALGWSGGWQATFNGGQNGIGFSMQLPVSETQLSLKPGDVMDGPVVEVAHVSKTQAAPARSFWMRQRKSIASGPPPSIPLAYNHWYVVKRKIDGAFLQAQLAAMAPYHFDDVVVDAGWYDEPGSWMADLKKFNPGELESLLASIKTAGGKAGLWSAPQYVSPNIKPVPGKLESPRFLEPFLNSYLLDLWNSNYANLVTQHVQRLRSQFSVDYWKYDQFIFVPKSRAGAMKNVSAFQDALKSVRIANPDLTIENCMDGGQLINEHTLLNTQLSWLMDGTDNGLTAARANVQSALGALEFVFPWSAYRFTNRLDEMDQNDDELTKYYCRSAMAGVWGVSSDLTKIGDHQRSVILTEIANYRRLNEIKLDALYELLQPGRTSNAAGVTFYAELGKKAAIVLYRWNAQAAFSQQVALDELDTTQSYTVTDADTGLQTTATGAALAANGVNLSFDGDRLSGIWFVEPVTP